MNDRSVSDFLASVASTAPTPGGGSVCALAGALSVALSRMVAGLAVGKKGYEQVEVDLRQLEKKALELQSRLEGLIEEDSQAYEAVLAAMRMPRATATEKADRVDAMQRAYKRAAEVPLETIERCVEALEIAEEAALIGNRGASTDAGVAILLAKAAVGGASLNVRVNLASIRDESFRSEADAKLGNLIRRAEEIGQRAMALVESRL